MINLGSKLEWQNGSMAPGGLVIDPMPSCGIKLSWDPVLGADRYYIYRSTGRGLEKYLTNVGEPSFQDVNVDPGVWYYYKVTAFIDGQESNPSIEVYALTEEVKR
ncbi:fibronectin type III domain-containing protein [Neobacillus ginsengisoli]|uniref:Fibronectin type 3 domain-containing protein n=1 Tax=Neobacillus ginsengisoli TaxID=904295 RepID=A0ABT9XQX0_9BACI|nr:fibronectin type III domain-containing protein [Neobacillus ginsengisoli]MDQ0197950.1 fibronectin type 3 domain-containing protein [Neobacillus ginsengisoli]